MLGFTVSIAQILVAVLTAALLDGIVVARRHRVVAWPASGMLTGSGIALLLRVPGTVHGEWWSLHGAWIFAATAAFAIASKHLIRRDGHHVFNPSNLALLVCFLVLGPRRVEPLDFWWGPAGPAVWAALAVIVVGAITLLLRVRLLGVALAFYATFAVALGALALGGHCMTAHWHLGAICGWAFARTLLFSPEVLVFCCFMITDPRTVPDGRGARTLYASGIAVLAALLIAPQRSEFSAKVALLAALCLACAARPTIEHLAPRLRAWRPRRVAMMAMGSFAVLAVAAVPSRGALAEIDDAGLRPRGGVAPDTVRVPSIVVRTPHGVDALVDPTTAHAIARDLTVTAAIEHRRHPDRQVFYERFVISVARRPGQEEPALLVTAFGRRRGPDGTHRLHHTVEVQPRAGVWQAVTDDLPPGFVEP